MTTAELKVRLIEACIAREGEIRGCTEEEIERVESENGVRLPDAYKRFLRIAGRGAGEFMDHLTVFFPDVVKLSKDIRPDIRECIPKDAFVFATHMGEQVYCFMCDGDQDPPVMGWDELRGNLGVVYPSVWGFIEDELSRAEE